MQLGHVQLAIVTVSACRRIKDHAFVIAEVVTPTGWQLLAVQKDLLLLSVSPGNQVDANLLLLYKNSLCNWDLE